jgi:hypothetical protein
MEKEELEEELIIFNMIQLKMKLLISPLHIKKYLGEIYV